MAKLTGKRRAKLPASAFVYPPSSPVGGKGRGVYPIDSLSRARNALSRAAQPNTVGSYSTVARAVRKRYGNKVATVGKARGTTSRPGYRKRRRR